MTKKHEYRKLMTRPQGLIECECWDSGERLMLPKKIKNIIFFKPLFVYDRDRGVKIYYNFSDPKQDPQALIEYLEENILWFKEEKTKLDKECREIRRIIKIKSKNYNELFRLITGIWPMITMADIFGNTKSFKVGNELLNICVSIREETDNVLHPGAKYLTQIISNLIPNSRYIDQISYSEFKNNTIPIESDLIKRTNGWIYHEGKIILDKEEYLFQKNINLIGDVELGKTEKFIGNPAYRGKIKGVVRIIFEMSDLKKIEKGDVLVTPMTTPEMIPTLKSISAFVTDEGGIVCHAAIVAREMKKPCIIGTKIATQVLKDGDLVEVDADRGVVRILVKSSR